MGCCQSDLKGEEQANVTAATPQPMKKVATNFSTVDYDSGATNRRETVVAPHEEEGQQKKSHELPTVAENEDPSTVAEITDRNKSAVSPKTSRVPDPTPLGHVPEGGEAQQPYKDIDDTSPTSPTQVIPPTTGTTGTDPTNAAEHEGITSPPTNSHPTEDMGLFSKSKASADQPIMNDAKKDMDFSGSMDPEGSTSGSVEAGQVKEKKSLYRKFQEKKKGPGMSNLSDEELMKYTGKTRAELDEMAKSAPGVGQNQRAGSLTAAGVGGIAIADGGGSGLGGWGHKSQKDPVIR